MPTHNRFAFHLVSLVAVSLVPITASSIALASAADVVEKGISFGKGGTTDLLLDLARPSQSDSLRPAIVFIHGGGWRYGDRRAYTKDIQEAARRGYVAVSVEYRLTDPDANGKARNPFPAQVEDVKAGVRWLRANADKYHVDPNRIGVTGGSAGGHLSLMVGVTDPSAGLEGTGGNPNVSSRVQAVVNTFGPTDLAHLHATSKHAAGLMETMFGGPPESKGDQYLAASPIQYVSKDDPPTLTIQGTADQVVPPDQASLFDAAMRKAGAPHTLLMLEGQGHGFKGDAVAKADEAMFKFFDTHLKNGK